MVDSASDRASAEEGGKDKIIGEVLANRYRIETRLGEGAMGAVYKATHVKVGRAFAVKVLHSRLLVEPKVAQRFEREAELAGRLRHANVVGVVDVGETADGMRYMVMDFAAGPDLAALLSEAPMPAPRIMNLTRQLLEGLYHAHEAGLIHRDFKPENIIVEKDAHGQEVPRIVDFGIAILREGGDGSDGQGRLTTNGLVLGTPHYMAPEQAVADPIDHRIDLFALGIVIYEMLCGRLPFDGSGAEVARANLLLDPPPIAKRVPHLEVDPLLEAYARRLMAKKREARPATAKAARDLLDLIDKDPAAAAAALGVPTASREPAITAPTTPQTRRAGNPDDTFPPPFSAASSTQPIDPQRLIETAPVGLVDEPAPKRRIGLFAAIGVALVGAIVAVIVMTRGKGDAPAPPVEPKVAIADPPKTDSRPPHQPGLVPDAAAEVVAVAPVDAAVEVALVTPDAAMVVAVKPKVTPPRVTPPKKQPEPVKVTQDVPPVETAALDGNKVAAQYAAIGKKLVALGSAAEAMWVPYRNININDVMKNPALLPETARILAKLQSDIAAAEKTK